MIQYLSGLITSIALLWSVYSFVIKRRDDKAALDRKDYLDVYRETKLQLELQIGALKHKVDEQEKEFNEMKLATRVQTTELKTQSSFIKENYFRMEKVLDRHEKKMDDFGKVIVKNG